MTAAVAEQEAGLAAQSEKKRILDVANLDSGYGNLKILRDVSFHVNSDEIVTLIGSNGAGKTTILNTLCNIVKPRAGTIHFLGNPIHNTPAHEIAAMGLAHVPEGRKLFTDMTVLENLEMGAFLRRDKDGIREDIEKMYDLFPILKTRKDTAAGSLSGGEQQMCAIARGMLARPKLLLLDEPSLGLSPKLVDQIFDFIRSIHASGTPVLLVEQNAHMALNIADRGYVLATGEITLSGPGKELLGNDMVRKLYLGEA